MTPRLTWLHVSDVHFGAGTAEHRFDQQRVTSDLLKDAERVAARIGPPDLVLITGDIAFSARADTEYPAARTWVDALLKGVGATRDRALLVPGNHDSNRRFVKDDPASGLLHDTLRKQPEKLNELLDKPTSLELVWRKLAPYTAFAKEFGAPELSAASPFWIKTIAHALGPVSVVGLNSCLLSYDDGDDPKNLILTQVQLQKALGAVPDDHLVIALHHHPVSWLRDGKDLHTRLSRRPHLNFCGHVHEASGQVSRSLRGGELLELVAGAGHGDAAGEHHYAWGSLAADGLRFYPRAWSKPNGMFVADGTGFPEARADECVERPPDKLPKPLSDWLARAPVALPAAVAVPTGPSAAYDPALCYFSVRFLKKGDRVVGRAAALAGLRHQLTEGRPTNLGRTAALIGLGGLGKTQIAVEYAHEYKDSYPGGVFWFDADQDLDGQLARLAVEARWIHPDSDPKLKLEVARNRIRTHAGTLLVFDSVEEFNAIEELLPEPALGCHLLATSKAPQAGFEVVKHEPLGPEASLELLTGEAGRAPGSDTERGAAQRIVERFEGLPIALEMAGAFLRHQPTVRFGEYWEMLERKGLEARALKFENFERESLTGHDANLYATLKIAESAFGQAPALRPVLDAMAWSGAASMGRSVLLALLGDVDPDEVTVALGLAESLRIAKREGEDSLPRHRLHRLVQDAHQARLPLPADRIAETVGRLAGWFEHRRQHFERLPEFEGELDHLIAWGKRADSAGNDQLASRLLWLQAYPLFHRGRLHDAAANLDSALSRLLRSPNHDKGARGAYPPRSRLDLRDALRVPSGTSMGGASSEHPSGVIRRRPCGHSHDSRQPRQHPSAT